MKEGDKLLSIQDEKGNVILKNVRDVMINVEYLSLKVTRENIFRDRNDYLNSPSTHSVVHVFVCVNLAHTSELKEASTNGPERRLTTIYHAS